MRAGLILAVLLGLSLAAHAKVDVYQFTSPDQQELYQELIAELRCLVCQNQNIADSNAELAQDLRRKTYELVIAGNTKDEIHEFMTQRYGNFVLYRPPLNQTTWLLWVGPFLVLALGIFVLVRVIKRQRTTEGVELSDEQHAQARKLLDGNRDS